jgi:AhpC/TSA family protein
MTSDTTHATGWKARDFALQGIDGKIYSLAQVRGPKGTLVVFICNHCPYVKASINRIVAETNAFSSGRERHGPELYAGRTWAEGSRAAS